MACFNRRETTLRCLSALMRQASGDVNLVVHLLDDASPDGTAEAVADAFPEVVVLAGDGHCFWGGGMARAMQSAMRQPFDFMLWLNDDVVLDTDAIPRLLAAYATATDRAGQGRQIVVGAMRDPTDGTLTYGGFMRASRWHPTRLRRVGPASDDLRACDTLNGNCVLVPREVVERVGLIDPVFVQQLGDIDYGYRARVAGVSIWLAPGYVGTCSANPRIAPHRKAGLGLMQRWAALQSPHGLPIRSWWALMGRHAGLLAPVLLTMIYAKALLPERRP